MLGIFTRFGGPSVLISGNLLPLSESVKLTGGTLLFASGIPVPLSGSQ